MRRFAILLLVGAAPLAAQVTETPVPFDSAGAVRTLTPALVDRFQLSPPAWPVTGAFLEARLFSSSAGGYVLAVERPDLRIDRFPLTADGVAVLRGAVQSASVGMAAERPLSEPVRGAFVRNQMLATWIVYGPSLAALSNDAKAGTALYLLATGASYFITTSITRRSTVTAAQNHLATDGALRGWGLGAGIVYSFTGDDVDGQTVAGAGLAGALGGAVLGFNRAKRFTDAEAQATTSVSNLFAATAFGVSGASGLIDDTNDGRVAVAATVAAGLVGYALGPTYPRRAKYAVTSGDIQVTQLGALLGGAIALTPFIRDDTDVEPEPIFAAGTAGLLLGTYLTERQWARRYDHGSWDAGQTMLGTAAGGLMGAAAAVFTEPNAQTTYALVVGGSVLGALIGHNLAGPPRAASTRTSGIGTRFNFDPSALGLAAAGVPGRHALISLSF